MKITFDATEFEMVQLYEAINYYSDVMGKHLVELEEKMKTGECSEKRYKAYSKRFWDLDEIHTKIAQAEHKAKMIENN